MIKNLTKDIFIDVDDTLANTRKAVSVMYENRTGDRALNLFEIKSKKYCDFCPLWTDSEIEKVFLCGEDLYSKVEPLEGAIEGIKALEDMGFNLKIVTMNPLTSIVGKQKWIEKYFPTLKNNIEYIDWKQPNKDSSVGLSIIDDDIKNVKTNKSHMPILLDFYGIYNDSNISKDIIVCKSWKEITSIFEGKRLNE